MSDTTKPDMGRMLAYAALTVAELALAAHGQEYYTAGGQELSMLLPAAIAGVDGITRLLSLSAASVSMLFRGDDSYVCMPFSGIPDAMQYALSNRTRTL